jgi:hypothetical protein
MKTLRDERKRLYCQPCHIIGAVQDPEGAFFREYGGYRVVEGELCEATNKRGPLGGPPSQEWRDILIWDGEEHTTIGTFGDHVTLIIPPKKKGHWDKRTGDELWVDLQKAQRVRDVYKKALREIGSAPICGGTPEMAGYERGRQEAARIAREALDEQDTD